VYVHPPPGRRGARRGVLVPPEATRRALRVPTAAAGTRGITTYSRPPHHHRGRARRATARRVHRPDLYLEPAVRCLPNGVTGTGRMRFLVVAPGRGCLDLVEHGRATSVARRGLPLDHHRVRTGTDPLVGGARRGRARSGVRHGVDGGAVRSPLGGIVGQDAGPSTRGAELGGRSIISRSGRPTPDLLMRGPPSSPNDAAPAQIHRRHRIASPPPMRVCFRSSCR
jgi:hypothetical protein